MTSISSCTQACGWVGAFMSCLCFGSFAVPIKSKTAKSLNIDPLVFQSYKTILCFLTSWIFIFIFDQPITFTPWGLVSASFWVPAAVAAIYAIQNAGLATAIGISGSCIVLVSFSWGIFIFQEKVRSVAMTSLAILLMIGGIAGMSSFSSPNNEPISDPQNYSASCKACYERHTFQNIPNTNVKTFNSKFNNGTITYQDIPRHEEDNDLPSSSPSSSSSTNPLEIEIQINDTCTCNKVHICGLTLSRRTSGLAAAALNGLWGGSILVPMHFAPSNSGGVGYLISFAIGASVVTLFLWIIRFVYLLYETQGSWSDAYDKLPSFHIRKMWLLGGLAGTLWSIGNVASIFSVKYLGEAVGYSITQAAMIVSGLWGIFFFKEVTQWLTRLLWFCSAFLTLSGIILLSYEHMI